MSEERCCSGGVIMAFLAGGLIGAGLALLYAPYSGKETRGKITGLTGDLKAKTEGWTTDLKTKVESFIEEQQAIIKAAYDAGREAMEKEKAKFAPKPAE
ncbi:MAG: YtxH domain-containing protein [Deltaproteobacteria bacterium]|nr:YtxH domain-containing protein [Deltaproteobacteria bacterium]